MVAQAAVLSFESPTLAYSQISKKGLVNTGNTPV